MSGNVCIFLTGAASRLAVPNVSTWRHGGFMFIDVLPNCSAPRTLNEWTPPQCNICTE